MLNDNEFDALIIAVSIENTYKISNTFLKKNTFIDRKTNFTKPNRSKKFIY